MFCNKCGAKIPDNSKFCTNCGEKLSESNTQQSFHVAENTKSSNKGCMHTLKTVAKVIVGLFVLLLLISVIFGGGKKSKAPETPEQKQEQLVKQQKEYQDYMAETYSMMQTVESEWAIVCDTMLNTNTTLNSAYETLDKADKVIDNMYSKFLFRDTPKSISDDDIEKMNEELGHWCNRHKIAIESMMEGVNKGRFSPKDNNELKKQILGINEQKQVAWDIIQKLNAKYLQKEGEQTQQQTEPTNQEKPKKTSTLKKIMDNQ